MMPFFWCPSRSSLVSSIFIISQDLWGAHHAALLTPKCNCNFLLKGSDLVYDTFLRPFVMQYEPNIEQRLGNLRAKSGQVLVFYIKNFTDKGMTFFLEVVHQVVSPPPNREHIRHEVKLIFANVFSNLTL